MKKTILLLVTLLFFTQVFAQTYKIKGTLKSEGKPISGANIHIASSMVGTFSNNQGQFSLEGIKKDFATIIVTCLGYVDLKKQIHLKEELTILDIELERNTEDIDEVVVTGTGTPYHIANSPIQTELVSKKVIKEISARNFEDLMMGLSPSFDFSPGSMGSFMTLNGLGNDYILVLVDGKRLYGDLGDQTDLNRINPENIEKIEIVKGASSSLYGSEAIAGVINVITKKSKSEVHVSNNSLVSKYGTWQQSNNVDLNFGGLSSHTSFSRKQTDGWQLSPFEYKKNKKTKKKELVETDRKTQGAYRNFTIAQEFEYSIPNTLDLTAWGSLYRNTIENPTTVRKYNYFFEDNSFAVSANYHINPQSSLLVDLHNDNSKYYYQYNQDYKAFKEDEKKIQKDQTRTAYQIKWITELTSFTRFSLGTEYVSEEMISERMGDGGEADVYTCSVFAQEELKVTERFSLVAGIRFIKHEHFGNAATPKLTWHYKLGQVSMRVNYANGFKAPTLKELYYKLPMHGTLYLGNKDLKPQKSDYFAASIDYRPKNMSFSVTAYHNKLRDMIGYKTVDVAPEDSIFKVKKARKNFNIAEARTQGIDFLANVNLPYGFSIGGGYSYVDAKDETEDIRLRGMAEHYGNVRFGYTKRIGKYSLKANIFGRLQDEKLYSDGEAKGYNIWKFSTSHRIDLSSGLDIELTMGVDNVFDRAEDHPYGRGLYYGTINPGRTFFAGLRLDFSR